MRRAVICLSAALLLAVSAATVRAQSEQNYEDQQNAREYTDEDSQPLKVASYFVAPVGFLLEWTIARPLHYVARNTFLAPLLGAQKEEGPAIPAAELPPPDVISEGAPPAPPPAPAVGPAPAAPQTPVTAADAERQGQQPATPPAAAGSSQPALH
jgi:hypothetical protein